MKERWEEPGKRAKMEGKKRFSRSLYDILSISRYLYMS
jgi:hypothetical protein